MSLRKIASGLMSFILAASMFSGTTVFAESFDDVIFDDEPDVLHSYIADIGNNRLHPIDYQVYHQIDGEIIVIVNNPDDAFSVGQNLWYGDPVQYYAPAAGFADYEVEAYALNPESKQFVSPGTLSSDGDTIQSGDITAFRYIPQSPDGIPYLRIGNIVYMQGEQTSLGAESIIRDTEGELPVYTSLNYQYLETDFFKIDYSMDDDGTFHIVGTAQYPLLVPVYGPVDANEDAICDHVPSFGTVVYDTSAYSCSLSESLISDTSTFGSTGQTMNLKYSNASIQEALQTEDKLGTDYLIESGETFELTFSPKDSSKHSMIQAFGYYFTFGQDTAGGNTGTEENPGSEDTPGSETKPSESDNVHVPLIDADNNGDGKVDASDAANILVYSARQGAGLDPGNGDHMDVNRDGAINATDASIVLVISARLGAGHSIEYLDEFFV